MPAGGPAPREAGPLADVAESFARSIESKRVVRPGPWVLQNQCFYAGVSILHTAIPFFYRRTVLMMACTLAYVSLQDGPWKEVRPRVAEALAAVLTSFGAADPAAAMSYIAKLS